MRQLLVRSSRVHAAAALIAIAGWGGSEGQVSATQMAAYGYQPLYSATTTTVIVSAETKLTPLQQQIEEQRVRLTAANAEERQDAVLRLGRLAHPESSRAALAALSDQAAIVRATATRAVLSLKANEAAAALIPVLHGDRSEFVRQEAAYALGETKSRIGVPALIAALEGNKNVGVRGASAVALGLIADKSAVAALVQTLTRQLPAPGLLNRIRRRSTVENEFVRRSAVRSLGQIGSRSAVPALIAVLETGESGSSESSNSSSSSGTDVQREAARALGIIGDRSAMPALQRVLLTSRDPYLSQTASEALRKLNRAVATRATEGIRDHEISVGHKFC